MEIREITDNQEIDSLLALTLTYPYAKDQESLLREQLFRELSEIGDNRYIFAGSEDGVLVAMIQLVIKNADNDPDLANSRDVAHVHALWVRHDRQGQGIGRQMMAYLEDKARQMGKRVLTLGVDDINARAIRLYEGIGYEVIKAVDGRTPEEKCLIMIKPLP